MRFTARPDKIEHTTARSFRFLEELNDPFGGTSLFSYDAKIFDHVITLDNNPLVTAAVCTYGGIDLSLSEISGMESVVPGSILAGSSETWACLDKAGINKPFTKKVVGLSGVTLIVRDSVSDRTIRISRKAAVELSQVLMRTGGNAALSFASTGVSLPLRGSGSLEIVSAVLHVETEDVPPTHCFEHLKLDYHRIAGADESVLRRRLQVR